MRERLAQALRPLAAQIEARTRRERVLLSVAGLALAVAGWYYGAFEPLSQRGAEAQQRVEEARTAAEAAQAEASAVAEQLDGDPEAELRAQIEALQQELDAWQERVAARLPALVEIDRMRALLGELVREQGRLRLAGLERLPPAALELGDEAEEGAPIYRHGVRVTLEGAYPSVLAYLEALEALPWDFYWHSLDYEVVDYPQARAVVELQTLAGQRAWIGL